MEKYYDIGQLSISNKGPDEDYSGVSTVFVNWKASDPESGIRTCEWAVGKH